MSNGAKETALDTTCRRRPIRHWHIEDLEIPCPVASGAASDSVSPGDAIPPRIVDPEQPPLDIGAIPPKIPGVWGRSLPGAFRPGEPKRCRVAQADGTRRVPATCATATAGPRCCGTSPGSCGRRRRWGLWPARCRSWRCRSAENCRRSPGSNGPARRCGTSSAGPGR
jgi:hypothetical protein